MDGGIMVDRAIYCAFVLIFSLYAQEETPQALSELEQLYGNLVKYQEKFPQLLSLITSQIASYSFCPTGQAVYTVTKKDLAPNTKNLFAMACSILAAKNNSYTAQAAYTHDSATAGHAPVIYSKTIETPAKHPVEFHISKNQIFPPQWYSRPRDDVAHIHVDGPNQNGTMLQAKVDLDGEVEVYTHKNNNASKPTAIFNASGIRQLTCGIKEDSDTFIIGYVQSNKNNTRNQTCLVWGNTNITENPVCAQAITSSLPPSFFFYEIIVYTPVKSSCPL